MVMNVKIIYLLLLITFCPGCLIIASKGVEYEFENGTTITASYLLCPYITFIPGYESSRNIRILSIAFPDTTISITLDTPIFFNIDRFPKITDSSIYSGSSIPLVFLNSLTLCATSNAQFKGLNECSVSWETGYYWLSYYSGLDENNRNNRVVDLFFKDFASFSPRITNNEYVTIPYLDSGRNITIGDILKIFGKPAGESNPNFLW